MKKSKIFLTTGTLILAVTAIFATKSNKKFTTVTTAHNGAATIVLKDNAATPKVPMTTTVGARLYAQGFGNTGINANTELKTVGGIIIICY
jgi:hypothetical protein